MGNIWFMFTLFCVGVALFIVSIILLVIKSNFLDFIMMISGLVTGIFAWFAMDVPSPEIYPLNNEIPRNGAVEIELKSEDNLKIYYTVDGSNPASGEKYTGKFRLDTTATVAARTRFMFFFWSDIEKSHYTIEPTEDEEITVEETVDEIIEEKPVSYTSTEAVEALQENAGLIMTPEHFMIYDGHTYFIYNMNLLMIDHYSAAEAFCENLGGHLAVMDSKEENQAVYQYVSGRNCHRAYFGYSDENQEEKWEWVNGSGSTYKNWEYKQPNNGANNEDKAPENYAHFVKDGGGEWNDAEFGEVSPYFICEWDDEIDVSSVNHGLESEPLVYDGHIYTIYDRNILMINSYSEMEEFCEKMGGHLAVIETEDENKALYQYVTKQNCHRAYFGYSDEKQEEKWEWINGSESTYKNWAYPQPNNGANNEDKAPENYAHFVKNGGGEWNDAEFGAVSPYFICERLN
ncbi:MAG: lectin-like protein [Eubacteriales bacterium]|nr:lectin-like protein [Eubacteriales bacterium]